MRIGCSRMGLRQDYVDMNAENGFDIPLMPDLSVVGISAHDVSATYLFCESSDWVFVGLASTPAAEINEHTWGQDGVMAALEDFDLASPIRHPRPVKFNVNNSTPGLPLSLMSLPSPQLPLPTPFSPNISLASSLVAVVVDGGNATTARSAASPSKNSCTMLWRTVMGRLWRRGGSSRTGAEELAITHHDVASGIRRGSVSKRTKSIPEAESALCHLYKSRRNVLPRYRALHLKSPASARPLLALLSPGCSAG